MAELSYEGKVDITEQTILVAMEDLVNRQIVIMETQLAYLRELKKKYKDKK